MNRFLSHSIDLAVPICAVHKFLHDRYRDRRITAAMQALLATGNRNLPTVEMHEWTISESQSETVWFGRCDLQTVYSLTKVSETATNIQIKTQYSLPWLLSSVLAFPFGNIMEYVFKLGIMASVAELIALENGYRQPHTEVA